MSSVCCIIILLYGWLTRATCLLLGWGYRKEDLPETLKLPGSHPQTSVTFWRRRIGLVTGPMEKQQVERLPFPLDIQSFVCIGTWVTPGLNAASLVQASV